MLSRRRERKGFTLIELMIVVAIIGILAAIAIPQFAKMREKGYDAASKSALGNIKTAQEAYYLDYNVYAKDTTELGEFYTSEPDVTVTVTPTPNSDPPTYTATATHAGSKTQWDFDSATGNIEKHSDQ